MNDPKAASLALRYAYLCGGEAGLLWQRLERAERRCAARGRPLGPAIAAREARCVRIQTYRYSRRLCRRAENTISLEAADPASEPVSTDASDQLRELLLAIHPRLRFVLERIFLEHARGYEVAGELGVGPSRISQLIREGLAQARAAHETAGAIAA